MLDLCYPFDNGFLVDNVSEVKLIAGLIITSKWELHHESYGGCGSWRCYITQYLNQVIGGKWSSGMKWLVTQATLLLAVFKCFSAVCAIEGDRINCSGFLDFFFFFNIENESYCWGWSWWLLLQRRCWFRF